MSHENKVQLIGHYGSDEVIACSAWTSTSRNLTEEKKARIPKLITELWKNGHETPFEKGIVHFLVETEIASHNQILKHRVSSSNFESARYKELKEDKFYLPQDWKGIIPSAKQDVAGDDWQEILDIYTQIGNQLYHNALKDLTPVLGRKRAKETARFFKAYNSQLEGDLMFNIRSFANFLKLRKSEHAQDEIHEIAALMLNLVKEIPGNPFEHTIKVIEESLH